MQAEETRKGMSDSSDPVEMISPEAAREALYAAIRAHIGDETWSPDHDEETEWWVITGHDYMMRLSNGYRNLDFHVDLLGTVSIEEKNVTPGVFSGQTLAWILLGLSVLVALVIAQAVSWL
jgi:hypothetical protein